MISRRKMTSVLAGVSLTALIVGIGEVRADPTVLGADVVGDFILVDPTDYFSTGGSNVSGNLINDTVVGPDPAQGGVSILITLGSTIGGDLINNVTAQTYVEIINPAGVTAAIDVAGIEIDGTLEGDLINNGIVSAEARAIGRDGAKAEAHGIEHDAEYPNAIANVQNNAGALIAATAFASVTGTDLYTALATAEAKGIDQWVTTGESETDGEAVVGNSGIISADAKAIAGTFTYYAYGDSAFATATGVEQEVVAGANAAARLTNGSSGTISAMAQAFAQGSYYQTSAVAHAEGVSQDVFGIDNGLADVVNQGGISASALAYASSFEDAPATARAVGIEQDVIGGGLVTASASNAVGATIAARATATAIFDDESYVGYVRSISANAFASGIDQHASGGATDSAVNALVQNDGTITADANAYATGRTYGIASQASAEAGAVGVRQLGSNEESKSLASLTNSSSGSIVACASVRDLRDRYLRRRLRFTCRNHQQRYHQGHLLCRCQRPVRRCGRRPGRSLWGQAIRGGGRGRCDRHHHQYCIEQHRGLCQCARDRRQLRLGACHRDGRLPVCIDRQWKRACRDHEHRGHLRDGGRLCQGIAAILWIK